nr:N-acetylmuramoyl-L-alanine amidase [Salmonella sp. NCTC 7297]
MRASVFWRGATRLNDTSVGIELENRGWRMSGGVKSFAPFESAQNSGIDSVSEGHYRAL